MLSESGRQRRRSEYSSGFKSIEVLKKIFKRLVLVQYWSLNPQTYTAGGGGGGAGGAGRRGGGGGGGVGSRVASLNFKTSRVSVY